MLASACGDFLWVICTEVIIATEHPWGALCSVTPVRSLVRAEVALLKSSLPSFPRPKAEAWSFAAPWCVMGSDSCLGWSEPALPPYPPCGRRLLKEKLEGLGWACIISLLEGREPSVQSKWSCGQ